MPEPAPFHVVCNEPGCGKEWAFTSPEQAEAEGWVYWDETWYCPGCWGLAL